MLQIPESQSSSNEEPPEESVRSVTKDVQSKLHDTKFEDDLVEQKGDHTPADVREFIKEKFLVDMPEDFYLFWEFCKEQSPKCPSNAFKDVGLVLVGPYDVLANKFCNVKEKDPEQYLLHWRYYYDLPEIQTVAKGSDHTGYHIGYFRDSPDELPAFLASNCAEKDGVFELMGDNMFAAVRLVNYCVYNIHA